MLINQQRLASAASFKCLPLNMNGINFPFLLGKTRVAWKWSSLLSQCSVSPKLQRVSVELRIYGSLQLISLQLNQHDALIMQ